jgi:hypothetical protein
MPATADALVALRIWLGDDVDIATLTAGRIFGAELPSGEVGTMPKKVVLVRWAGGFGVSDVVLLSSWRVDIWCYADTPYEASRLHRFVHHRMKSLTGMLVNGIKLYPAQEAGGPVSIREPETKWPAVIQSFAVMFADDP